MFIEQAIEKLKKNNQKITATRLWILHQIENTKKAINPYELLAQDTNATIDITTIYRNFELFEKLGIVHKIQSSGGYISCTHKHAQCNKPHDIVICNNCNNINEIHITEDTKKTFGLSDGPVELSGTCQDCR